MPIYRVPEMSSAQNFQNRHNHQPPDDRLRRHDHHQQQQQQQQQLHHQHHHNYHREQPFLDHMQTHNSTNEGVSMKRSHSNPTHMTDSSAADAGAADKSIVEREIRLQLEKEAEIASLHKDLRNVRGHQSPPETRTPPDHSGFRDGPEKAAGNSQGVIRHRDDDDDDADDDRRAIGHYSRAGDSVIVKELTEQNKREKELRSRYRNIGTIRDQVENGKVPPGKAEQPGSRSSFSSSSSSFSSGGVPRQATKVQPVVDREVEEEEEEEEEDEDEVDFRQIYIKPQNETLMEREVRLLRQREGSLRRVRGYPLPPKEERLTEVGKAPARRPPLAFDDDQSPGGQHHRSGDGLNMRRLATNRLKQEMLKERQREIDLRRQGKIYTISEERVGLDPSYLAVGLGDGNNGRGQSSRSAASDADLSTDVGHLHGVEYDAPPRAGSPVRPPRHQHQQQQRRSTDSGEATGAMPPWRTSAEMRIEAEVREAKRRENELREQRRLLNAAPLTDPQLDQSSSEEKNRSIYRRT